MAIKQGLIAVGGGLSVTAISLAMAATLGTITDENMGASTTVVTSCDNDGVTVDFNTAFDPVSAKQEVVTVDVSSIAAACDTHKINLGLSNAAGDQSASAVEATLDASGTLDVSVDCEDPVVDVDVHLLDGDDANACLARDHWAFTYDITPGRYFIVVDTYVDGGAPLAGPYTLSVDLR